MKYLKKVLAGMLSVILLLSSTEIYAAEADTNLKATLEVPDLFEVEMGSCGTNAYWQMDKSGTLTISGYGETEDYSSLNRPEWYEKIDEITKIVVEEGITKLGQCIFTDCYKVSEVILTDSVTKIDRKAFKGCTGLEKIELSDKLESIGDWAFAGCTKLQEIRLPASVAEIGKNAFRDSRNLVNIVFDRNDINDIIEYCEIFPVSALMGTEYLYNQFEMPEYNIAYRYAYGARPVPDDVILNSYVKEIIEENRWAELTDYEIMFSVYDWICENVSYTYSVTTPYGSALGAFWEGAASCGGYAEAYKLFMDALGIDCQFISGYCYGIYGKVSHMWNLVYYNGDWRHVDATDRTAGDYTTFFLTDYEARDIYTWNQDKYPHVYSKTVVKATCEEQGYTRYECNTCNDYYDADFTELGEHTIVIDQRVEPTIDDFGWTEGSHCSLCKKVLVEQKQIPKKIVSLSNARITLSQKSYVYDGKVKKPTLESIVAEGRSLVPGEDYILRYENNKEVGTAKVIIKGKGSYKGTVTKTFTIKKASISKAVVNLAKSSYTYDGKLKKPGVKSVVLNNRKLKEGSHYTVSYQKNKEIGKATVVIKGKGNYFGQVKKSFSIKAKSGTTFLEDGNKYKITNPSSYTVSFVGTSNKKVSEITIPDTVKYGGKNFKVTAVEKNALKNKSGIKCITIGKNVKKIGISAFEGCKKLQKITIKTSGLNTVGKNAFKNIHAKATITVPSSKLSKYTKLLKGKGQGEKVKIQK